MCGVGRLLRQRDFGDERLDLTGLRKTESVFMFGAIRWAHPRFDAVERRFAIGCPRDNGRPAIGDGFFANFHGNIFFTRARTESHTCVFEIGENAIGQSGIIEREFGGAFEVGKRNEFSVGRVTPLFLGGNLDGLIATAEAGVPWQCEIEVVTGAPGQGLGVEVFEFKSATQEKFAEFITHAELIFKGVTGLGAVVLDHTHEGVSVAGLDELERAIAGKTVLGHGAFNARVILPEKLFTVGVVPSHEWKQNGITAAHEADFVLGEIGAFGPM